MITIKTKDIGEAKVKYSKSSKRCPQIKPAYEIYIKEILGFRKW